jgi:hypothetical protein
LGRHWQRCPRPSSGQWRQRRPLGCAQSFQPRRCRAPGRFEAANAETRERRLDPVADARALVDQALALAARSFAVRLFEGRDRDHAAVVAFTAPPAEKCPLQQPGVEPIRLRPAMFAPYGDAVRMDYKGFDAALPQPTGQPETVAPGLEGDHNPSDRAAGLRRFIPPALQQAQQRPSSGVSFFSGRRSTPGTMPATSQLDWLISMTAITVLFSSRAASDRLRSFGCGMRHPIGLFAATMMPFSRRSRLAQRGREGRPVLIQPHSYLLLGRAAHSATNRSQLPLSDKLGRAKEPLRRDGGTAMAKCAASFRLTLRYRPPAGHRGFPSRRFDPHMSESGERRACAPARRCTARSG